MDFANNLKYLMTRSGISNYQLAKAIGCHQSNISYWLSGERVPQPRMRKAVADYFGVSISWLMGESSASGILLMTAIDNGLVHAKNQLSKMDDDSVYEQEAALDTSGTIDRELSETEKTKAPRIEKLLAKNEKSPAPEGAEPMSVDELLDRLSQAELVELMAKTAAKLKERGLE